MSQRLITLGSVVLVLMSLSLWTAKNWAAEKHSGHTAGMNHESMAGSSTQPTEGGQSAFAALIEIVALLEKNPETDWSNVDLDGLRSHLLDMNHLILDTETTKEVIGDKQIRFDIRGTRDSVQSIHRMVPAHSQFIQRSRGWAIESVLNDDGATLTVTVADAEVLLRLKALGFYGFMSLDSHHQAHHLQMAIGKSH